MSGSAGSGQATLRHDGGSAGGSGPVSDGFSPAGLKVLVVDDDLMCLKVVSAMLKRCSYQVATCSSGSEALTLLRERNEDGSSDQFDLVLSDVYMPDLDGFKLLEHIGLELELPVIMMSSNGDTNVVLRGVTHGAVDFLIKPVRIEELRNVWQHVVRRRSMALARTPDEGGHSDEDSQRHSVKRKESEQSPLQLSTEQGGNKKPRVVWSVEMHQQFVNAVNSLGIDKAVPKRILDLMNVEGLTRENVASHLQKYRLYLKRVEGVQSGAAASKQHQHPQYHQQQQQQQQAQPRAAVSPAAASFGALSLGAPQQAQQGMPQLGMPVQGLPPNLAAMGSQPPHIPFQQALAMQAAAAAAAASGALPGSLPPYMPPPGMMPPGMPGGVPGMGGVVGHPQMPAPGMDFAGFNGYGNAAGGLMFGGQQQAQHAQQHTSAQAGSLAQQQAQQVSMGLGLMPPSLGFPPTSLAAPAPRSTATEPAAAPLPLTSSPPAASAGGSGGPAAAAPQHSSGAAAAQPPHHHSQCSEQGAGGLPPPLPASSAPQSYPLPPPSSQAALHDPDEHYPPGSAEMHHQHLPGLCGFGPDDLLGGQLGDMGFLGELGGAVGGKHEQDDFLDLLLKGEEEL